MAVVLLALLLTASALEAAPLSRDEAVSAARKLLADERGLEAETLEVERAEATTWPDASLGCPEKDHMYAQVLSEGFRVVLRHGSERYDVRVAMGRAVLCGARTAAPVAVADIRSADKMQRLARADLALRLGVAPDTVRVAFVKPVVWPDASLGCPGEGAAPPPAETPGFEIRLTHGGRRFTYHSDHERVVPCGAPSE